MRQHPMTRACPNRTMLLVVSIIAIAASGCSKSLPTDPTAGIAPEVQKASAVPATTTSTWSWYSIASKWVNKGEAATVAGGRYKIQFVRGSLGQGASIAIMERDASITDVIIGPSGTTLSKAATLTISYAGSTGEAAPDFLKLYRFNDLTGAWEVVAGTNDPAAKMFSAKVSVLCRYALSPTDPTKAGW